LADRHPRADGHAYTDKLDGKVPEDFLERKMSDWRLEEQVKMAIEGLNSAESMTGLWTRKGF
jgi:hypothetical protein